MADSVSPSDFHIAVIRKDVTDPGEPLEGPNCDDSPHLARSRDVIHIVIAA